MIPNQLLEFTAQIVAKASREEPLDTVLRLQLRSQKGFAREDSRIVSRAAFAYFRWLGWLDPKASLKQNVDAALDLAETFKDTPSKFSDKELLAKAVPEWAKSEMEVSPAWCRTLQAEPKLWLRTKPGKRDELRRKLGDAFCPDYKSLTDALEYAGSEDLFRAPEFQNGEFELQDISSQAVSVACNPQPGETWWDACAGEGGKLLHLSALMQNKGLIWASDRAEWRLKKLKQRAARAGVFNYRAALWEGGAKLPTKTKFDGVLVDAPCTGIGTWQRNPQARWTTTPNDIRELSEIQKQLLKNVSVSLKPGGKLIYSVCTLARAENEEVASFFDSIGAEFKPLPMTNPFTLEVTKPRLTFMPQECGGNGMFVAAWSKEK